MDDNDKRGFIDAKGEWVIPPRFKRADSFATNGLARAEGDNGKQGFIDAKGEWVIPPRFESAKSFDATGLASVRFKENDLYIDSTGRSVVPVAHDLPASAPMKVRAVAADTREVLNARGDVVLIITQVRGVEVSKNLDGEITSPPK
jgi:hypothetical protein